MSEFTEVSRERFFEAINKRNVHPQTERDHSLWVMQDGSRNVIGKSEPGYVNPGDRKRWWLRKELV